MEEYILLRGSLEGVLADINGRVVKRLSVHNAVMTVGRRFVLEQLESVNHDTARNISHMAFGTDNTAPNTTNTALGSEVTRIAIGSFVTTNLTSSTPSWQAIASLDTNQGNTTLGEVGLFNSSASGTMLARASMSTVDKATSNTFTVTYTISG